MRPLLALPLAIVVLAATASASSMPSLPSPNEALYIALGLIGLGAGLSRPPEDR